MHALVVPLRLHELVVSELVLLGAVADIFVEGGALNVHVQLRLVQLLN